MARARVLLFLIVVIALSGCAGTAVDSQNPYGDEELNLYINDSLEDRDLTPEIESAIAYWETHAKEYAGYNISYAIVAAEDEADVKLVFDDVYVCGLEAVSTGYNGCADIIESPPSGVVEIEIQRGLADPVTEETIKHELGHTLGLRHGYGPSPLMDAVPPSLNNTEPVHIHIQSSQPNAHHSIFEDIEAGVEYYADHEKLNESESLDYTLVDSPSEAHLLITPTSSTQFCEYELGGSCTVRGPYFSQTEVRLERLDSQVLSWHVANALWPYFFAERPAGLEADSYEEREEWAG